MADSAPTTGYLDVPGARLYYERRGSGPLLLVIGSPMDSTGFTGLAAALADDYTVVTYDPRGIGDSTREDPDEDITPEMQADDVHRLISALGGGPVDIFGSSGGGAVGLALVTARPDEVRTLVAHEPPLHELLPDSAQLKAEVEDIYDTYRSGGQDQAMPKFLAHIGLPPPSGDEPAWQPPPEQLARMRATTEVMFGHLLRQTTRYRPNIDALRALSSRIVVGVGAASKGQVANRAGVALAEALGTTPVEFPGDHGGLIAEPEAFAGVLRQVL